MTKARAEGGTELDAFDTYLVDQYKKQGAVETGRAGWNPDYATAEIIDALGQKEPDFVSMNIGGYFPERKFSEILGPRPQEALPRKTHTPTGKEVQMPKSLKQGGYFDEDNKKRIFELVDKGLERGGDKWYHLGGVLDAFVDHQGVDEGLRNFDEFMNFSSALSPRSKVAQELKRASVLRYMKKRGQDVSDITKIDWPKGYGHLANKTAHAPAVKRIEETGAIGSGVEQPKISSYAENRMGNYQPMTIDSHNNKILTGREGSPSANEYPFLERGQTEWAEELGLDPAEYQSALWVGADDITGVADSRNMTAAINQRIAKTAEETGLSEEEVAKKFMDADIILRMLMGGVGTGAVAGGMMMNNEPEMQ